MTNFLIASALKGAQWERTKGELRAMVALQGSYSGSSTVPPYVEPPFETLRWQKLDTKIKAFIDAVENDGLHE